ncbi:MAG: ABC transporter substrate-binding protein [Nocardiopsaceae bacterium]|nr:ABC transporter substrate-binding protein [Nocardiopsaceae bacterium]
MTRYPRTGTRAGALVLALGLTATATACGTGQQAAGGEISDLVVDVRVEPDSLDPMYRNTPEAQRYYRLVYSSLLRWNDDKELEPDLATEMPEVSDDRTTYRIELAEGVTFHDGTPLTAEDVVFTYEQVADPDNGTAWLSALSFMDSIEAEDDHTVVIELTEPYTYMESRLAMIPILSSEDGYTSNDTHAQTGNGSGPYKFEEMTRGESLVLRKNEEYFGGDPEFDSITFEVVPEDASRVARLANGTSHIAPDIPGDQVELVKDRGQNAATVEDNGSRMFFYPSMLEGRPTTDADFRLAIARAIDRGAIVEQVYDGAARPNSTYLSYGSQYHDEELGLAFGEEPDVEKAKEHLKESGVELDRELSIIALDSPDLISAATIIQANLEEIGIEAKVESEKLAGFYPKMKSGEYDLILYDVPVTTSTGFAPDYVNGGLNSESANNFNSFGDPEMDTRLEEALTAESEDEQQDAWRAVQEYDLESQGNIQVVVSQTSEAWSTSLEDYEPSSLPWLNAFTTVD